MIFEAEGDFEFRKEDGCEITCEGIEIRRKEAQVILRASPKGQRAGELPYLRMMVALPPKDSVNALEGAARQRAISTLNAVVDALYVP